MSRIIEIECKNMKDFALYLKKAQEELNSLRYEMRKVSNNISVIWQAQPATIFHERFESYINLLKNMEIDLLRKSEILGGISYEHENVDDKFKNEVDWSDYLEQQIKD